MSAESGSPVREVCWQDKDAIVYASGEIDSSRSMDFQQELLAVLDKKPGVLVVNLTEVAYMDSSGLASLVKIMGRARKFGSQLRLCGMSQMIRGLFEVTKLDSVFSIYSTLDEALAK